MKKYLFSFLFMLLILFIYLFFYFQENNRKFVGDLLKETDEPGFTLHEPIRAEVGKQMSVDITEITTTTIAGVGDILMSISVIRDANQQGGTYDFKPMFELVKPYINETDIAFANQETILGGNELGVSGYPLFNSPYEVGDALIDTGFDVVGMANNHTLDKGEQGILNAIEYYNSTELIYTGAYQSENDRSVIRTIESNGITFAFLAYSYGTNGMPIPNGKEYLINLIDVEVINEDIVAAKEVVDIIVLSLHFGNEYERLPNATQRFLAEQFSNAGADIIFGHHPHVLQPMEWIEREDGSRTFVAYSLGNFLSGQVGIEREIGGIVQLKVEKTRTLDQVSFELKEPRFLPTFTYKQNWTNYKIYPLHEIHDDRILKNAASHLQQTKKHVSFWMPELKFELIDDFN